MDKTGECFNYLSPKFPQLAHEKVIAVIFDGSQIRHFTYNIAFLSTMQRKELITLQAFSNVVNNFLVKYESHNYRKLDENLLQAFHNFQRNVSVKVYFLHSHLKYFRDNLGAFSEEQRERFLKT